MWFYGKSQVEIKLFTYIIRILQIHGVIETKVFLCQYTIGIRVKILETTNYSSTLLTLPKYSILLFN